MFLSLGERDPSVPRHEFDPVLVRRVYREVVVVDLYDVSSSASAIRCLPKFRSR